MFAKEVTDLSIQAQDCLSSNVHGLSRYPSYSKMYRPAL
ncbi:hypothetical protein SAMN05443551_1991 [Marivita hallyeonensis]|uniref:Uncharacterized protein n=1 Tax=Marivita hallyeonensis TaxID=996342 RepID=A0A1M5S2Z4_9RHOB|nr:hypothetical protein SAMN05443551_1991 [Marivita hallyeonensis]